MAYRVFLTALSAAGFVLPLVAAVVAYRGAMARAPKDGEYGSYEYATKAVPAALRNQIEAVKVPAVVALAGVFAGALASALPLWFPVDP